MKKLSAAALLVLATTAYAQPYDNSMTEDAIKKRLAPIGAVYLEGEKAAAAEPTGPRSGEQVYQAACFACHGTGALGAPKSADDWAPRIAKGKDVLLEHSINGFNAMPPRGTCMDCSDDEISAAIDFMTAK
ncbi:cytochrome c5 family protein [Pseudoalteromonas sp.]|uniref:c-type cytochrome n=1 Tax=Pseudoalteromonas sp. TaxID=53249 RepID=UPI001BCF37B2|nr:cytochrome c5 family protein [Pseudoalteromonas sp.]